MCPSRRHCWRWASHPRAYHCASAPKPLAAHYMVEAADAGWRSAFAVDVAPYFLAGGGVRELDSFRSNSVGGRLMRVLQKTVASAAVSRDNSAPGSFQLGLGVRSTIHDPHDPVLNWGLADSVAARLAAAGIASEPTTDEERARQRVELADLFARAGQAVRARCCLQIALGWGAHMTEWGEADADSSSRLHHQFWAGVQFTPGSRYDLLATLRLVDAFDTPRLAAGAGVQRKGTRADLRAELFYDDRLLPSISIESRLLKAVRATAAVGTRGRSDELFLHTQFSLYHVSHD